ncbi:unnamed protein product [Linum tenue]|uniref:(+)-delta-cadinene synthase n=1 Tax=Linum tenue TaxID=586396 RepID=A0AAV0GQ29_9ROSI|nr:unnamed protein product [Linum tenue]
MLLSAAPTTTSEKLKLIDVVERLGIGYHFEEEIEEQLRQIYHHGNHHPNNVDDDDLFTVALHFRLLRQHGYNVPSDVFKRFQNEEEEGTFKEELGSDVEGMMGLYEAAHLHMHGETILDQAIEFATTRLTKYYEQLQKQLARRVAHVLKRPLRKGVERHEQLFFISVYEQMEGDHDAILLKLAKLSWNSLQHSYQQELRSITQWDTSMKDLPEYMKLLYGAIIDVLDEVDAITTREGRPYCLDYGKQAEKNQMRAYLAEARWFAEGKVPTIEEYRRVGVYSCTYPLLAYSALAGMGDKAPKEAFDWLLADPKILVALSDHCRLMDDIVSHEFEQKRGHVSSSVECYMKQHDVSRVEAVDALNRTVEDDWKVINEECLDINRPDFVSKEAISMLVGLVRVMEVIYKDFDGYTFSNTTTMDMMNALLVTPIEVVAP